MYNDIFKNIKYYNELISHIGAGATVVHSIEDLIKLLPLRI